MKVKLFDEQHELDLENSINLFLEGNIVCYDIKYQICAFFDGEEQVYLFSAMILYE